VAIAVTALAAQVSPPNADTPAPTAAAPDKSERKEIKLPASTLDRYVGTYLFQPGQFYTVRRKGDGLEAQMTGQPAIEIFAQSETAFFYKVIDAQLDFVSDGGPASSVVLHQGGGTFGMQRTDESTMAQMKAEVAARIASNAPAPGSEAATRKMVTAIQAGNPNFEDMTPGLADAVRAQQPQMKQGMEFLGPVQSVEFVRVGDGGWDVYRVKYKNGSLLWRIGLTPDGKVNYALTLPDA
jgi:hypothetical protein